MLDWLADIPTHGKTGWPWQDEPVPTPTLPGDLPRITIITPSYQQGRFLEETIRSVLLQGYPNLQYLVIDGGSTDESVEIIRRYAPGIDYWVSERDHGQADAINKGFRLATGDLVNWINSDDLLMPGALWHLAAAYRDHPDCLIVGDVVNFVDGTSRSTLTHQTGISLHNMIFPQLFGAVWHQPGIFVPAHDLGGELQLDESLRYCFDQEWTCRLLRRYGVHYVHQPLAKFRLHSASKTVGEKFAWFDEQEQVVQRVWDMAPNVNKPAILARFALIRAAVALGRHKWNRRAGWAFLGRAARAYPPVIASRLFLELAARSVLPQGLLLRLYDRLHREE